MSGGEHRNPSSGGCGITILVVLLIMVALVALAIYVASYSGSLN